MVQHGIGDMLQFYFSATTLPRLVNPMRSDRSMAEIFYHMAQRRTPDLLFFIFTVPSWHYIGNTLYVTTHHFFCVLALRLSAITMHPVSEGRRLGSLWIHGPVWRSTGVWGKHQGYWENTLIESWRRTLHLGHSLGIVTFFHYDINTLTPQ